MVFTKIVFEEYVILSWTDKMRLVVANEHILLFLCSLQGLDRPFLSQFIKENTKGLGISVNCVIRLESYSCKVFYAW